MSSIDETGAGMAEPMHPLDVLRWHIDAGVDATVGESPGTRVSLPALPGGEAQPKQRPQPSRQSPQPGAQSAGAFVAPAPAPTPAPEKRPVNEGHEKSLKTAVRVAGDAASMEELKVALEQFDGCALKKTASNTVFGAGDFNARIMLVGEAPGAEEDRRGVPFVGASGELLEKMLASINITRDEVFITNTVFWRPPGNRTPNSGEIALCMPFVERMVELVDPEILVCVGAPAAHALLGQKGSISRLRGRWLGFETPKMSRPAAAIAIYHPDYLLKSPAAKRPTWADLLAIREKLDNLD